MVQVEIDVFEQRPLFHVSNFLFDDAIAVDTRQALRYLFVRESVPFLTLGLFPAGPPAKNVLVSSHTNAQEAKHEENYVLQNQVECEGRIHM